DRALGDGAEDDRGVRQRFDRILGAEERLAGDLVDPVEPVDRLTDVAVAVAELVGGPIGHDPRYQLGCASRDAHAISPRSPVSSARTETMVRLASGILNALWCCGSADASSASAAL